MAFRQSTKTDVLCSAGSTKCRRRRRHSLQRRKCQRKRRALGDIDAGATEIYISSQKEKIVFSIASGWNSRRRRKDVAVFPTRLQLKRSNQKMRCETMNSASPRSTQRGFNYAVPCTRPEPSRKQNSEPSRWSVAGCHRSPCTPGGRRHPSLCSPEGRYTTNNGLQRAGEQGLTCELNQIETAPERRIRAN